MQLVAILRKYGTSSITVSEKHSRPKQVKCYAFLLMHFQQAVMRSGEIAKCAYYSEFIKIK